MDRDAREEAEDGDKPDGGDEPKIRGVTKDDLDKPSKRTPPVGVGSA